MVSQVFLVQAPLVAVIILTVYFMAVVSSFYHELVAPEEIIKHKEKAAVTFHDKDASVGIQIEEETVLVSLDQDQDNSPPASLPTHPCPEEVISLPATNPFVSDIFSEDSSSKQQENTQEKTTKTKPNAEINLRANFTPFKKNSKVEGKTPAKMKVFLPGAGGDESDFDFSFTDPDFDSSLCADSHPGVEDQ